MILNSNLKPAKPVTFPSAIRTEAELDLSKQGNHRWSFKNCSDGCILFNLVCKQNLPLDTNKVPCSRSTIMCVLAHWDTYKNGAIVSITGHTCAFPVFNKSKCCENGLLADVSMLTKTTTLRNTVNNNVTISHTEQIA